MERWTDGEIQFLEEKIKENWTFRIIGLALERSRASVAGKVRRIKEKEAGQLNLFEDL